ncbi:cytochrome c biogenesis protein CcsA [Paenibacillus sp. IHBB 10380]|uniref:cytochrome c biogenesis protein CcsA n=1 Tax=Paenibacillus sp. IHBB 10380 TaxID=1566358 RepID=UPI0005CFD2FC|nr:cytochrome c biogenesis protein CcsA [Paenibacillus sp. IHBB 10380]AJS57495.1 ABC transporter permease [Paenibacillus sp. IHBB 10380]
MILLSGIYDAGIYIYALSLLFFFLDCIRRNLSAKRMGTGLLIVVWLIQSVTLGMSSWQEGRLPLFTVYDFLFIFSFSLVTSSLCMSFFRRAEFAVLLLSVIGFCVMVLSQWYPVSDSLLPSWEAVHGLLIFHIVLANLSFAAFTVAAVFATMYLFLHRKLKYKKWNDTVRRLPSLEMMDKYSYYGMLAGTPILSVSLLVAVVSIIAEGRFILFLDLKVLSTFVGLSIFIYYFIKRSSKQNSGTTMAKWALIGYAFIMFNFLFNLGSNFH